MKIAVTGAGGAFRTRLALALGRRLDLPVIAEDMDGVITAELALQRGANSHDAMARLRNDCLDQGLSWLQRRRDRQLEVGAFVADGFAFDLLQRWLSNGTGEKHRSWFDGLVAECRAQAGVLDLIVMPPLQQASQRGDKRDWNSRISHIGQLESQALLRGLMDEMLQTPRLYLPVSAVGEEAQIAQVVETLRALGLLSRPVAGR